MRNKFLLVILLIWKNVSIFRRDTFFPTYYILPKVENRMKNHTDIFQKLRYLPSLSVMLMGRNRRNISFSQSLDRWKNSWFFFVYFRFSFFPTHLTFCVEISISLRKSLFCSMVRYSVVQTFHFSHRVFIIRIQSM